MGKQIPVVIYEKREELLQYILEQGYIIVTEEWINNKWQIEIIKNKEEIKETLPKISCKVYIANQEILSTLKIVNIEGKEQYVGRISDRFIDVRTSNIRIEEKTMTIGRIYFGNGFSTPITKEESEMSDKIYKCIVKWIKKNLPYREIATFGKEDNKRKVYIEEYCYDLLINYGYITR